MPRYHFDEFVLSPSRRLLLRGGAEQPLIPRYFDLLVFLLEHRHEAVHRRDIFERVWNDAVVSDSALSQAIRTIRRVLDDDPREPRYIRTVSRHGYRFVFTGVREEDDDGAWPPAVGQPAGDAPDDVARTQGVATDQHPPLAGTRMWARAAAGGAIAGVVGGSVGGLLLATVPGSSASFAVSPALAFIGACCGAVGGAGVGAGLSVVEAITSSRRIAALVLGAAAGGGLVGTAAQWLGRWSLATLVGIRVDVGGSLEGLLIGAAAGFGYGVTQGGARLRVVAMIAAFCGLAALVVTFTGRPLVGGTIHAIATTAQGSQAVLTPLGRLIGEPDFGRLSSAIIGTGEGLLFGLGLSLGLTRRSE